MMALTEVEISLDEGKFGVTTDNYLRITNVIAGSATDGKLMPGDIIVTVNGEEITSKAHLESVLLSCHSKVKVGVSRARASQIFKPSLKAVLGEFNEQEVEMRFDIRGNRKLGLIIKDEDGYVLVARTLPHSVSDDVLQKGDLIIRVNDVKVNNKDEARHELILAIKTGGKAKLLIYRPEGEKAKRTINVLLPDTGKEAPSFPMNSDVLAIAKRQMQRNIREKPTRGILGRRSTPSSKPRVTLKSAHSSVIIGMDPTKNKLQHVKKQPKPKFLSESTEEDDSE